MIESEKTSRTIMITVVKDLFEYCEYKHDILMEQARETSKDIKKAEEENKPFEIQNNLKVKYGNLKNEAQAYKSAINQLYNGMTKF